MDLLLDTHTFIWFINGDGSLPEQVRSDIKNINNRCFISIASLWEMAIKLSLNKLQLQSDFNKIAGLLADNDIEILPITFAHIQVLLKLEFHHRDPFDRIIIAQGATENLLILTRDENFNKYRVKIKWD
ncbi:twitching motility protein PilT [Adhaeribacter aerolatus]|uniref:Twitching motility protein PilT n=1 Tax=Adhaeribacter aerolatus TaxID=670289 RepID=A0A512AZY7_9BACT|nr:type II toxin-antitoxin system VapC family toxin [Adhaeribacter aerolatus]GEO05276.1 twitching motility protein PilT [Adhaeribacter aerolatus]